MDAAIKYYHNPDEVNHLIHQDWEGRGGATCWHRRFQTDNPLHPLRKSWSHESIGADRSQFGVWMIPKDAEDFSIVDSTKSMIANDTHDPLHRLCRSRSHESIGADGSQFWLRIPLESHKKDGWLDDELKKAAVSHTRFTPRSPVPLAICSPQ